MSLSSLPDTAHTRPFHGLGKTSKRRILCDESYFRIYHESLIQDEQHSRFYHFPNDAFIFVLYGQGYLSDSNTGLALNQYQGCWISPDQVHKLVLLSPHLELIVVAYQGNLAPCAAPYYDVNQTGDDTKKINRIIDRQKISHRDSLSIELEFYPAKQAEHLHYHRQSDQFIMALKGEFNLKQDNQGIKIDSYDWVLVNSKQRHRLKNMSSEESLCLSIYSPPPTKDRVLVLTKK